MKITACCTAIVILTLGSNAVICAQEFDDYYEEYETGESDAMNAPEVFEAGDKIFLTFNYGAAASWLTRIINQTGRSNFVFKDFMPGLYFSTDMRNIPKMKFLVPTVRLTAYYPLAFFANTSTFNGVPQLSKGPLHFGVDMVIGAKLQVFDVNYARLTIGPGLHMLFLTADRWNYFNLGGAVFAGIEAPLSAGLTFLINGYASLDSGNLGSNRKMEPFDITYQYQLDVGVRYSKKMRNSWSLFGTQWFKSPFQNKKSKQNSPQENKPDEYDEYLEDEHDEENYIRR